MINNLEQNNKCYMCTRRSILQFAWFILNVYEKFKLRYQKLSQVAIKLLFHKFEKKKLRIFSNLFINW